MQWPEPWEPITPKMQQTLQAELKREVSPGHPLHSVSAKAIAHRFDCDDVLFSIEGSASVAVVHLSYGEEVSPAWPHTQIFSSLSEWKMQQEGEQ